MIILPDDKLLRAITIDNGSTTLGLAVTDIDLDTEDKTVLHSETIDASRTTWRYQQTFDARGARWARMRVLARYVLEMCEEWEPDVIAIEAPFMFRRPEAFAVLREVIVYLQEAIDEFDDGIEIILVPPTKAKMAVGANEYVGKDPVRDAVLALKDVHYDNGLDPRDFDEHQIDAVAVMYHIAQEFIDHLKRRKAPKNAPTRRTKGGRRKRAKQVSLGTKRGLPR